MLAALGRISAGERITTVALSLGYSSPGAFAVMFRRVLGVAPSAYRRRFACVEPEDAAGSAAPVAMAEPAER